MIQPHVQQPADLKLMVTDDPTFEQQFTVLKTAAIAFEDWLFTFQIIGESHIVTATYAGILRLQETLVCADLPPERCLHYYKFATQTDHTYQTDRYGIEVCFPKAVSENQFGLEYRFPKIEGQVPVTRIGWRQNHHEIAWWTLHTYPHKHGCTYVETRSYFDYTNRG
jgi:hypothetical protein